MRDLMALGELAGARGVTCGDGGHDSKARDASRIDDSAGRDARAPKMPMRKGPDELTAFIVSRGDDRNGLSTYEHRQT